MTEVEEGHESLLLCIDFDLTALRRIYKGNFSVKWCCNLTPVFLLPWALKNEAAGGKIQTLQSFGVCCQSAAARTGLTWGRLNSSYMPL